MQENLLGTIEKQIENSKIYNEFMIYSKYTTDLAMKIFNSNDQESIEFKKYCQTFRHLLLNLGASCEDLESILPAYEDDLVVVEK